MNFNSIKWRLQIWYGLVLVAVLGGLGLTAGALERSRIDQQVDAQLHERTRVLAGAVNGPRDLDEDMPPPARPADWRPPSAATFHLAPRDEALFDTSFYFLVTSGDGGQIAQSLNFRPPGRQVREVSITTPTGEKILIGHVITVEVAEFHRIILILASAGAVILFCGLAIGWLLVSRALRPIAEISAAAEKISTGDLARRIDVAETKSELGRLAAVLNTTFARLDAAFTLQKRFAADAAHELRTPVSVLIAQTHAALIRRRTYEENFQTIEACHRAAQRMRQLIVSLLQLARLDAGHETATHVVFSLLPVVSECVELVRPLADEQRLKIILHEGDAQIIGNPEQIHQVVANLLTNAIQYNQPEGTVAVRISVDALTALVEVSDTGIGLSPADLPHIFERFYRAEKSRTSGNSGLGLAITKTIVEAHGGTIKVSSEENMGAVFTVAIAAGGCGWGSRRNLIGPR